MLIQEERDDLINPYWIEDPNLMKGEVDFLTTAEIEFWKDLIDIYLRPIDENKEEQVSIVSHAFREPVIVKCNFIVAFWNFIILLVGLKKEA